MNIDEGNMKIVKIAQKNVKNSGVEWIGKIPND